MTASTVNGSGNGVRSGAQTLVLLAAPLTAAILRTLATGPQPQAHLRRETGLPPQTTLRAQLARLVAHEIVEKRRRNRFPGVLEYELTEVGRDLIAVVEVVERWLNRAPDGPLSLGGNEANAATKALADGWSATVMRTLSLGPLSLTELDRAIGSLSYPSLERRLSAMRLARQVEPSSANGRKTPYVVTRWAREAVAPLVAAARWEYLHRAPATAPDSGLDIEAAFALALPLIALPGETTGSCRLVTDLCDGKRRRLVGVTVEVRSGAASVGTGLAGQPDAQLQAKPAAWLDALIENDARQLELRGDRRLAGALLDGLHRGLFTTKLHPALDVEHSIGEDGSN